jgi:hypothetical protein
MPIKVSCKCGKKFVAKDELAGKVVKCPECGAPVRIGNPQAQPPQSAAPQKPAAPTPALADLFDEAGIGVHEHDPRPRCPGCDAPVDPSAVLCTHCGLNIQSGKRLRGVGGAAVKKGHGDGHEAAAEALLAKAEKALKAAPMTIEEPGSATWINAWLTMFALIGVAAVGFVLWLAISQVINAPEADPNATATADTTDMESIQRVFLVLIGAGTLLMFVAKILIAVHAFKTEDVLQGLLCIFIDIFTIIYAVMRWNKLQREVLMYAGGFALHILAVLLLFVNAFTFALPSSPQSLAGVVMVLLILALYLSAVLLSFTGWGWAIVVGFMEKVHHGILAILMPAYATVFSLLRRSEHPILSRIWLAALGCWVAAPTVAILTAFGLSGASGEAKTAALLVLGVTVLWQLSSIAASIFVVSGMLYAATAIYNLACGERKNRLELPGYVTSLRYGLGVTFGIWTLGWFLFPMIAGGGILFAVLIGLFMTFPQALVIGADLTDRYLESGFPRGLIISAIQAVVAVPAFVGLNALILWAILNIPMFVEIRDQFP